MPAVRKAVATVDPTIPLTRLTTQADQVARSTSEERLFASLCGALAVLTLLLASAGLYGLLNYEVTRRTAEIGVRMALGAGSGDVVGAILREALLLLAAGVAIGGPIVWATGRLVRSRLFGVQSHDPVTLVAGIAALATVVLLAAWLPARRAARVDPMVALRCE